MLNNTHLYIPMRPIGYTQVSGSLVNKLWSKTIIFSDLKVNEAKKIHLKSENGILFTILGQDVNRSGIWSCLSEKCSNLLPINNLANRVVPHPVADDNGGAMLQGPQG